MCGIFGFYNPNWQREDLHYLAFLNVKRGNKAFGGLAIGEHSEIIFRYSVPYSTYLDIPRGDLILCHSLASTGDAKRVHPFETDRFILAHNGILLNHKEFNNWYIGPVDSQYILGGIQFCVDQDNDVLWSITHVNSWLNGQRACWMWDKLDKVVYFWRVMSPLFYTENPLIFSSTEFPNSILMDEGTVYKSENFKTLLKVSSFKFYSMV